jgi:ferritin
MFVDLLTKSMLADLFQPKQADHNESPTPNDECALLMEKLVVEKYRLMIAYANYGDQLRHFARDGIHEHFQTHIAEERAQAYELAKKLTAMGRDAPTNFDPIPKVDLSDPRAVFTTLHELELAGVHLYQQLFDASKHDAALNGLAQNGAVQDQQHADDMARYLRAQP